METLKNVLWIALGLLAISSLIPQKYNRYKSRFAGLGWAVFAIYWFDQPAGYLKIGDFFNVVVTLFTALFCIFLAYKMLWIGIKRDNEAVNSAGADMGSMFMATSAAAAGGFAYFIFAEISALNRWIISTVTVQTTQLLDLFNVPFTRTDWNMISVNGYQVEIILACTAIESIALFIGVILSVNAPAMKMFKAFMISVPVIYILNLFRNAFVVTAFGLAWFGPPEESFYIAHTVIAKIGSTIALFLIAYAVMKILPELIDMIDGVFKLLRGEFKHINIGGK